jgi:hypothetical protein
VSAVSTPARARSGASTASPAHDDADPPTRSLRALPFVVLGLIAAVAAAFAQTIGWQTSTFTNDEVWGVVGGRLLERDFFGFIAEFTYFDRGPERIVSVLQILPNALLADTADQLRAIHLVLGFVYFLTVVPAYLLARGVGLGTRAAVLVAVVTIATPWVVFGGTLLTVTVALPANTLFAYAAWRAAVRPSLWGDVLVLAAAAINTLSRTGHAPFTAVALMAVVYAVWLRRPAEEATGRALLRLPLRVARTHPLLVAVFALAALVVLRLGIGTVVGSAYESASNVTLPWDSIWLHLRDWFMQLTMATGYLPLLIGAPWMLWQVARPSRPETGVFSVVALGMFLVFVYITSTHNSVSEERYVAVLAALPVVAFGAAIFRREARPLGTLVVGLLAARAIATLGPFTAPELSGYVPYQILPARRFFEEVLVGRTTTLLPADGWATTWATLIIVAVAVAAALLTSRRGPRLPRIGTRVAEHRTTIASAVAGAVLLFGLIGAAWTTNEYGSELPAPRSIGPMTWVDEATDKQQSFMWTHFADEESREVNIFLGQQMSYFNEALCCGFYLNDLQNIIQPDGTLPGPPSRYLVRIEGYHPLGFDTTFVDQRRYGGSIVRLERFDGPPRATVRVGGPAADGTLPPGDAATLAFLPGARRGCAVVEVVAPGSSGGSYRMRAGRQTRSGRLTAGQRRRETVRTGDLPSMSVEATRGTLRLGEIATSGC